MSDISEKALYLVKSILNNWWFDLGAPDQVPVLACVFAAVRECKLILHCLPIRWRDEIVAAIYLAMLLRVEAKVTLSDIHEQFGTIITSMVSGCLASEDEDSIFSVSERNMVNIKMIPYAWFVRLMLLRGCLVHLSEKKKFFAVNKSVHTFLQAIKTDINRPLIDDTERLLKNYENKVSAS